MKPLTQQLRAAILASPGKFASEDFFKLCASLGLERTEATKQIRPLLQESKIELVGYRQGNSSKPLYKVVCAVVKPVPKQKVAAPVKLGRPHKEPETLKGSADRYYALLSEKEKHDKRCADRLEAAMRGRQR